MHSRHTTIKAHYAGEEDFRSRIPELRPLAGKKVAVVGVGSIGAPLILELVKSGIGEIIIVDCDTVEAGNACRWPLGIATAGFPKAHAIAEFVQTHYPWSKATPFMHKFGQVSFDPDNQRPNTDFDILDQKMGAVDLVIDASAEMGVQHLISDWAWDHEVDCILVSGTQGGWGGEVVRISPSSGTGCWMCYVAEQEKKGGSIPTPPAAGSGPVQPRGCGSPTFTGAGFDMLQIAVVGARVAASTLCSNHEGAYPALSEDVFIISLRDGDGHAISVNVSGSSLAKLPTCRKCGTPE